MSGQQEIDINQLPHISLFLMPTGQIGMDTNMDNKIGLYGLLEIGKEMVQEQFSKKKSNIVAAPASALGILDK